MLPATDVAPRRARAREWWWTVPPLVLLVLGAAALARGHGLWYDEVYTSEMARMPLGDLLSSFVRGEGTISYLRDAPPSYNAPYYVAVHLWLAVTPFGPDELGLRLLSLVAAVAAVAVLSRAVAALAGWQVGLVAGLFAAANPFVVQYAVEARGYALALLGVCLAALGLARWLDEPEPPALWLYGSASAAAGIFHWYALLVPAGLAAAALLLRGRRAIPVVWVTAAAAVPAAAVAATALANGVGTSGAEWLRGVGAAVPALVLRAWAGRSVLLLVATLVTVAVGLRTRGPARVLAACWVAVPLAAVTAAELVRPVFVDRYLLPAAVGLAVLMALGTTRFSRGVTVAVLAVTLVATVTDLRRPPKDDVRRALGVVAAQHRPGEPVVAAARWDALGVDHYVRREHPQLGAHVVLPSQPLPPASTVWVVRRAQGGVKGDRDKLRALEHQLAELGLGVVEERRFEGRYADVLVQRWKSAHARVRAD